MTTIDYTRHHGWVTPLPDGAKARCGGPEFCATCRAEAEDKATEESNKKFDEQLWTFIAVNNETGEESELYGHATNNVFVFALAQAMLENCWLKVVKYVRYTCDWNHCEGLHPNPANYCSFTRRNEWDELDASDYFAGDTGLVG